MERSNTVYPYEYELDCTQHNGKYNKTKKEWFDKQILKQHNYNIKCDTTEIVDDKTVKKII
jgi:hypothetical protein